MGVLLGDETQDGRATFIQKDFTMMPLAIEVMDADGWIEYQAAEFGMEPQGQIVIERQPLTHSDYCEGCLSCWSPEIQTEESWRGI